MSKFVAASRESAAKLNAHGGGESDRIQSKSKTDNRSKRSLTLPRSPPSTRPSGERIGVRGFEPENLVPPHPGPLLLWGRRGRKWGQCQAPNHPVLFRQRDSVGRITRIFEHLLQSRNGDLLHAAISKTDVSLSVVHILRPTGRLVGNESQDAVFGSDAVGDITVAGQQHWRPDLRRIQA